MTAAHERIFANHERIRESLRRLLGHVTGANQGDLVAALALAGDLTEVVKGLEADRSAGVLGGRLDAALDEARQKVARAASSISYVFSVRVILGCVADLLRLLDDIELELLDPPASHLAAS